MILNYLDKKALKKSADIMDAEYKHGVLVWSQGVFDGPKATTVSFHSGNWKIKVEDGWVSDGFSGRHPWCFI